MLDQDTVATILTRLDRVIANYQRDIDSNRRAESDGWTSLTKSTEQNHAALYALQLFKLDLIAFAQDNADWYKSEPTTTKELA